MTAFAVEGDTDAGSPVAVNQALPSDHSLQTELPHVGPVECSAHATRILRNLRAMYGPLSLYVNQSSAVEPAAAMCYPRDEFGPRDDDFLLGLLRDDVLLDGDVAAAPRDCIVPQLTPIWVGAACHDLWRDGGLVLDVERCLQRSSRLEARQGVHFIASAGRSVLRLLPARDRAS